MMQVTDSEVRSALGALSKNDEAYKLANSALQMCEWMIHCRWEEEPNEPKTLHLQLKTLLHWAIEQLSPDPITATAKEKENRTILQQRYIEGLSVDEVATREMIAASTVYLRAKRARKICTHLLNNYRKDDALIDACFTVGARLRYEHAAADAQKLLQQLSVYQLPVAPFDLLHPPLHALPEMRRQGLVWGERQIEIHPQLRAYVKGLVSAEKRQRWSEHAAQLMLQQGQIWQAHHYLFDGGYYAAAATLLIDEKEKLLQHASSLNEILNAIERYKATHLPQRLWTQLKLLAARFANRVEGQQGVLDHLAHADHPAFQAYAELHRAIVNRDNDRTVALDHFARCEDQSNDVKGSLRETLLAELYLRRSGAYLVDPIDFVSAETDLAKAKKLLIEHTLPKHLYILMHIEEGRINHRKKQFEQAFSCWEAGIQLARDIKDVQSTILLIHNIGAIQTRLKQDSLGYLLEGHERAQQVGDRFSLAHFEKIIGGYYFHRQLFEQSATHNRAALHLFSQLGNIRAEAFTCFDLAEALIRQDETKEAKTYFTYADEYARANDVTSLSAACAKLASDYPELIYKLNTRQQSILDYVRTHHEVTKKEIEDSLGIKRTSFHRDVGKLVQLGILSKLGNGRSTKYVLSSQHEPSGGPEQK